MANQSLDNFEPQRQIDIDIPSAEETQNAPKILPIAIGTSIILNGVLGFCMLLAILFSMPDDIQGTLNSITEYPFIDIYTYTTGSNQGGTALVSRYRHVPFGDNYYEIL